MPVNILGQSSSPSAQSSPTTTAHGNHVTITSGTSFSGNRGLAVATAIVGGVFSVAVAPLTWSYCQLKDRRDASIDARYLMDLQLPDCGKHTDSKEREKFQERAFEAVHRLETRSDPSAKSYLDQFKKCVAQKFQ